MSGLIFNAIGDSLGRGATNIADLMYRSIQKDEDRELRAQERLELQRERLAAAKESRESNEALRRDLAGQRGGSGGGGGLDGVKQIEPGGLVESAIAGELGLTVPEYQRYANAQKTGDLSQFEVTTAATRVEDVNGDGQRDDPEVSDAISRKTATLETESKLPEGFEKEFRDKAKTMAKLQKQYIFGKDLQGVSAGAQKQQEIDTVNDIVAGKVDPAKAGRAKAASEGKDIYAGDSNVTRDKFSGETSVTPVGKSQISENLAQAGSASASAGKNRAETETIKSDLAAGKTKGAGFDKLSTQLGNVTRAIAAIDKAYEKSGSEAERLANKPRRDSLITLQTDIAERMKGEIVRKTDETTDKTAVSPPPPKASGAKDTPPPLSLLKEGRVTSFANGQEWTIRGGRQVRVK